MYFTNWRFFSGNLHNFKLINFKILEQGFFRLMWSKESTSTSGEIPCIDTKDVIR